MPKRSLDKNAIEQLDRAITELLAGKSTGAARTGEDARAYTEIAPLVEIAAQLRDLPREEFKNSLKSDLQEGRSNMATMPKPDILPEPTHAAMPVAMPRLTYKDVAKAIAFYTEALGAKENFRFAIGGKIPHAEISIGETVLSLSDEWPEGGRLSAETIGQSPVQISLRVPDVDAFAKRAVAAGLKALGPIRDQFYGRREGSFVDPFGYTWNIGTVTEEMSVEEMHRRFAQMAPPEVEPKQAEGGPRGFSTLTQYLVAEDADALVTFLKKTFDAEEVFRSGPGSQGGMHCELRLEDSMLMVGGGGPGLSFKGEPKRGAFHVYVRDCDATYERALAAGAESIAAPRDQEYGERSGSVKDKAGNSWYIATSKGDDYKSEGAPMLQPYLHPLRAEPVINFLKRAFGARDLGRYTDPLGVMHHATIEIGSSHMEMGEAQGPYQPMPAMFYLYVPDCDAVYRSALAAGATSVHEPMDQPYGDRSGAVKDPFGNEWWVATHVAGKG